MIKIAIVDDDQQMIQMVYSHIEAIENLKQKLEIHTFSAAKEFLRELEQGNRYEIVLSDIEMPDMQGLELGKILKEQYSEVSLIFLTSYPEYAAQSYVLDAYQYILKAEMKERLPQILTRLVSQIQVKEEKYTMVKTRFEAVKVFYKDIIYIKKIKGEKYALYETTKGEYSERISLEQILKNLDSEEFILVERGYIVNFKHIVKVKGNVIYLTNGENVTISRARLAAVKEQIYECWEKIQ